MDLRNTEDEHGSDQRSQEQTHDERTKSTGFSFDESGLVVFLAMPACRFRLTCRSIREFSNFPLRSRSGESRRKKDGNWKANRSVGCWPSANKIVVEGRMREYAHLSCRRSGSESSKTVAKVNRRSSSSFEQ